MSPSGTRPTQPFDPGGCADQFSRPRTSHGWPTAPGSMCPGASTVWKETTVMAATDLELPAPPPQKPSDALAEVVVYFAGDSGDGIQAIGGQFGHTPVRMGNDIVTFPASPA